MEQGKDRGLPGFILEKLSSGSPWRFVLWPAGLVCLILFIFHSLGADETRNLPRHGTTFALGVFGFSSMGASVGLLYVCQFVFGSLFHQVGMIAAIYMLALAAGSFFISRRTLLSGFSIDGKQLPFWSLGLATTVFLVGWIAFPLEGLLTRKVFSDWLPLMLFYLDVFLTGFFSGSLFPLAAMLYGESTGSNSEAGPAGWLDFADHFGAAAGAFLAGVIFIPAWGLIPTSLALSLAVVACSFFLYMLSDGPSEGDTTGPET